MSPFGWLLRVGRPPAARLALAIALGVVAMLAGVGLMGFAGYLISRAAEHPPVLSLTVAIVAVRLCGLGRPVARYFERLTSHDIAFRVLARIRVAFYRRLEPLVPGSVEGYRHGGLLAAIVGDVDATQDLFLRGIAPPLVALITGCVSVAIVARLLPEAGLVLAIGLLVGGVGLPALAWRAGRGSAAPQVSARAELSAELVEILQGAPELVVAGAAEERLATIGLLEADLTRLRRRDALAAGSIEGLRVLVAGLTTVGVLAACVYAAASGTLDRVLIGAIALAAIATFDAVAPLPAAGLGLRTSLEAGRRLMAIAGRRPAIADPPYPDVATVGATSSLNHVSFDHPGAETWGLRDVDLRIPAGSRIALVGHSGAGKSTVAELLVRFMDPDAGQVRIGDLDIRRLSQRDVRSTVSLDGQDAFLFATTIRENVRFARPDANDAAIERALRRARVWAWVTSLPDGWDTFVGEGGSMVSGGERRRIALARSFLADAPVMVLDEPTGHLDPDNAAAIVNDVLTSTEGKSVLLITHGEEGLDAVDAVVELRRGRIAAKPDPS